MDSITHGLLGAVTAQLGFRQRIGRDAAWVAAAAAMTPDLDVFVAPILSLTGAETDGLTSLSTHRGLSHSLLAVPVIALLVTSVWWWARRALRKREGDQVEHKTTSKPPPPFALLYACVLIPVLCHPLLDWCTSYGTQLFLPITHRRYAIDAVPIIDIIYTPILLLTLIACFAIRRITRSPAPRATRIVGWAGFLLSVGYIATGAAVGAHVKELPPKALNHCVRHAYPQLGTIFLWRITAEDGHAWYVARYNILFRRSLQMADFTEAPKVDNQWVEQARELPEAKTFDWFAMGQLRATYAQRDGLHVVEFHDMRYGPRPESAESMWSLRVTFDDSGRQVGVERVSHYPRGSFSRTFAAAWRDIWRP